MGLAEREKKRGRVKEEGGREGIKWVVEMNMGGK